MKPLSAPSLPSRRGKPPKRQGRQGGLGLLAPGAAGRLSPQLCETLDASFLRSGPETVALNAECLQSQHEAPSGVVERKTKIPWRPWRFGGSSSLSCVVLAAALAAGGCVLKDQAMAAGPGTSGASAPPPSGGNLLKASTFEDGKSLPWMTSFTTPGAGSAAVENGTYCLKVDNKGTNPWDAQVRHREMTIQKGHSYSVQFKAYASQPTKIRPKVGMAGPPYKEYWSNTLDLSPTPQLFTGTFKMDGDDDPTAEFAFHVGGGLAPAGSFTVCFDDIYLTDPEFTPAGVAKEDPAPIARVNQLGYLPKLTKTASIAHASTAPLDFQVVDSAGKVVFSGKTRVVGADGDSGEHVHLADFSAVTAAGKGYTLKVAGESSYPFDIAPDVYRALKYDALLYFYHNRSGVPIRMPYARAEHWARPAGHAGDKRIPCAPGTGCNYSLDVSGGWYDAGDHGKYVVNGGISVWTVVNQYERARHLGASAADFGDRKLNIPESGNGVPDILDEARWELEFLMKMQVPDGQPRAGMAHHKIHDQEWTALAIAPHDAEKKVKRFLRPPSTAATLNLAATAAQCARVFKPIDPAFAGKCLASAERAWVAARKNPSVFAPSSDNHGGGPYDDQNVSDEFYWAAAELFITTNKPEYKQFLAASPHHRSASAQKGGATGSANTAMTWQSTAALGTISLAVVPNGLGKPEVAAERNKLVTLADQYRRQIAKQGYRIPLESPGGYPWGSNSFILNNLIILGLAHDFTGKNEYLSAMSEGADYLFGRNPLGKSYVTGYGERPLENPHHRFWSFQADSRFPKAPPGAVSGGPNSSLQDPYAQAAGLKGCAPQKCFMDHIESWSTNEITVNWNAPLAWITAFLDEKGR